MAQKRPPAPDNGQKGDKYPPSVVAACGRDWRAGVLSAEEIKERHGIRSVATLRSWIARYGWKRDLQYEVNQQRRAMLQGVRNPTTPEDLIDHEDTIRGAATIQVALQLDHRRLLMGLRNTVDEMQLRLARYLQGIDDVARVSARNGKNGETVDAVMPLFGPKDSPAMVLHTLSSAISKLIPLELQNYGIKDGPTEGGSLEQALIDLEKDDP